MALFDTTAFRIVEQGMSVVNQQIDVITHNLANQDTPDYKCKYLYFSAVLKDKIDAQNSKYKKRLDLESVVYTDEDTKNQPDGNNVDADTQSALLAKQGLLYQALINQMNSEFGMIRTALNKN